MPQQYTSIIFLVVMIAVFYFFVIRPQKKQEKELRAMLDALKEGDKVVTIGGINGKVMSIKDDTILLETGAGTNKSFVKVSRWGIKTCLTIKE